MMGLLKDKNRKRTFLLLCFVIFVLLVAILLMNRITYQRYCKRVNQVLYGVLEQVKNKYPKVQEESLIQLLNGRNEFDANALRFLEDYGINMGDINLIEAMYTDMIHSNIINVSIVIFFGILLFAVYFFYLKKQDETYQEIIDYIADINHRNYDLCVQKNEEGEISRLKNELYKITVMLKEQADCSINERESLKESVADLSHQLKTPLTSIAVMLESLRENEQMGEITKREFLQNISRQIDWLNHLVVVLLKLARFDAGVVLYRKETIQVKELINRVIKNLSIAIEVKDIHVIIEGQEDTVIYGDLNWETEAMTNILKNAIEHTPENGKITISLENNYFFTKIKIKDTGKGMEKEDVKHVFDRFYKGKDSPENSVGIGLALAKKIIEQDNGYINVDSSPGKGTCFEIKYMP